MAEQTLTIKTNRGAHPKGAFFCSGFKPDGTGKLSNDVSQFEQDTQESGTTSEWMDLPLDFTERTYNDNTTIWFAANDLHLLPFPGDTAYRSANYDQTGKLNNLTTDVSNEVVYVGDQYLGRTVTTEIASSVSGGDSSIDVDDASDFPSSGGAFIVEQGSYEAISYGSKTTSSLDSLTRGEYNTSDAGHSTDVEIVGFDDDWQDLGSEKDNRPIISIEDWVFAGNGRYVAGYKESDGSDFSTVQLDLPQEYTIVSFSSILTGSGLMLMVGANRGNTGDIFVWDMESDTWDRSIHLETNIEELFKRYIITGTGIYRTDGFKFQPITDMPGGDDLIMDSSLDVRGIAEKGELLYLTIQGTHSSHSRDRCGLWILDERDWSWYHVPSSYYGTNLTYGGIYITSGWKSYVGSYYNMGHLDGLNDEANDRSQLYQVEVDPDDALTRQLKRVTLDFTTDVDDYKLDWDLDYDVILRYYTGDRFLTGRTQLDGTFAEATKIGVTDTLVTPKEGDRIEILKHDDSSYPDMGYAPRNITDVTHDTGNSRYELTLDKALPNNVSAEHSEDTWISPLKKIGQKNISGDEFDLEQLQFNIPSSGVKPQFKKLILEVELRSNKGDNIPLILNNINLTTNTIDA